MYMNWFLLTCFVLECASEIWVFPHIFFECDLFHILLIRVSGTWLTVQTSDLTYLHLATGFNLYNIFIFLSSSCWFTMVEYTNSPSSLIDCYVNVIINFTYTSSALWSVRLIVIMIFCKHVQRINWIVFYKQIVFS
jgi:hypothetical protein